MANRRGSRRTFGSVRKLPSGRFQARYIAPDKREHKAPTTFLTKGDADAWLAGQWANVQRGSWEPPAVVHEEKVAKVATRLGEYADEVLERRKLRETTVELYRKLLRTAILPTFGTKTLAEITPQQVQRWYAGMKSTPTKQANSYGLLKSIMKDAVEDDLIVANPCKVRGGSVKTRAKEPEVLTAAELRAYFAAIGNEDRRVALMLAGWCGLRSGEVRGLRRRDLDLTEGVVRIEQQAVKVGSVHVLTRPKTDAGVRSVSIPPSLLPTLREWLSRQPMRGADGLLFAAPDGTSPLSQQTLRDAHVKGRDAIGKPGLTVHGLRHTSLTLLGQLGASVAELQARAGHTTATMALKYQHAAAQRDKDLAERMSALTS